MGAPGVRSRPFNWELFDAGRDYEVADGLRRRAGALVHMNLDDAVDSATDLLEQPPVWESVERVAAELVRFRKLTYDDLKYLVY